MPKSNKNALKNIIACIALAALSGIFLSYNSEEVSFRNNEFS